MLQLHHSNSLLVCVALLISTMVFVIIFVHFGFLLFGFILFGFHILWRKSLYCFLHVHIVLYILTYAVIAPAAATAATIAAAPRTILID